MHFPSRLIPSFFLIILIPLLWNCTPSENEDEGFSHFQTELKEWQKNRFERLKGETGWVNLAGLFWLDSSYRAMGYGESSDFELQYGEGPETILIARVLSDSSIDFMIPDGLNVTLDSALVSGGQVYTDDYHQFAFEHLRWFFIERDGFHAIRLRDLDHPKLNDLPELKYFPASLDWKKEADFTPYHPAPIIDVSNVLGRKTKMKVVGELNFEQNGAASKLILFEGGPNLGFLIFADKTNGESTYGGGRYLYIKLPKNGPGKVELDFNRAYSPPCEFTDYATCAFPPPENVLPYKVDAGEKSTFKH
jgi:uncharacterized protein (DUF1684 family)